ncbi:MAG: serine/threonine protein kinase [Ahniella sp.]|nr:serine/threonine protein kinase [Ahniella sp.]
MNTEREALAWFDRLVELDAETRAAELANLRAQNEALATQVALMLDRDVEPSGPLDRGLSALHLAEASPPKVIKAGDQIGGFTLGHPLGRGGMGEVWLAERVKQGFGQRVALKVLHAGLVHPDLNRRFLQECRILAQLSHPRIAGFIDGGVSDEGRPWYAMAFVEGEPLNTFVARTRPDVRARIRLLVEIAEPLAHAQAQLIVHRDLKPSNILVDAEGHAHLLDFGIAKLLDAEGFDSAETATGLRALSPAYAAPEQVLGERISTATDVYSLGLILYELLTGRLPHDRRGARLELLAEQVRRESFEPPSQLLRKHDDGDASLVRAIDADLDTIAMKATQADPNRRYQNAQQFGEDLTRWLEGRPILAQADTATYRLRKFVFRHRLAVGSAAVTLLALILGLATALWQANEARQARARAEASRLFAEQALADSRESQARTQRVKQFLMDTFVTADPLQAGSEKPLSITEAFDQALLRVDTLSEDPKLQVDLWDDFGEIRAGQGRFDESQALFDKALAQAEKIYPEDHPAIAEALVNRGVIAGYAGDNLAGAPITQSAVGNEAPNLVLMFDLMAEIDYKDGRLAEAAATNLRQLDIARRNFPAAHPWTASALTDVGWNHVEIGEVERGIAELDEAIEMYDQLDSPRVLHPLRFRAIIARNIKGDAAARVYFDRAWTVCRERAITHLQCDIIRANRAGVMATMGEGQAALDEAEAALVDLETRGAIKQSEYAQGLESKALALAGLGRRDDAIAVQQQAVELINSLFPDPHPERERVQKNLRKL